MMNGLRRKVGDRPLGVWIATIVVAIFLLRSFLLPVLLQWTNLLAWLQFDRQLIVGLSLANLVLGVPLATIGFVGLARRRFWGASFSLVALVLVPLLPLIYLFQLWQRGDTPPTIVCIGTAIALVLAFLGGLGLFANRRWFDEDLTKAEE